MKKQSTQITPSQNPLQSLDEWEDDLLQRYPVADSIAAGKDTEAFRDYDNTQKDGVREFYKLNHTYQTFDFVSQKKKNFYSLIKSKCPCGMLLIF